MKFSVCLDSLFRGMEPSDCMPLVKKAGMNAIEFWTWWDKDLAKIKEDKAALGLHIATFCTRFVSLVDDSYHAAYLTGLKESIAAAQTLDCSALITQVGQDTGLSRDIQHANLVKGLKMCVPVLEESGVTLMIEPLNLLVDHKGYYLAASDEAFQIIDEVGSLMVKVLFDIYHQQITEGHLISRISRNIYKIGHFHAAGNPGRHELDQGEINYPAVFKAIDEMGYQGYIGLEYFPTGDPVQGLLRISKG